MTPNTFNLSLSVELFFVKTVVSALLNSILWHRSFSEAIPKEITLWNKITTVKLDDPELDRDLDQRIDAFMATLNNQSNYMISLALYDKIVGTTRRGWFGMKEEEERVEIERWNIELCLVGSSEESVVVSQVRSALMMISKTSNETKQDFPAISNTERYPFPFQVIFSGSDTASWKLPFL